MGLIKKQRVRYNTDFITSFFLILLLLCSSIVTISCHEENEEEVSQPLFSEEDIEYEDSLKSYLRKTYSSSISQVTVTDSSVEIVGKCVGEGNFCLGEITPFLDVVKLDEAPYKVELTSSSFKIVLDRFVA